MNDQLINYVEAAEKLVSDKITLVASPDYIAKNGDTSDNEYNYLVAMNIDELHVLLQAMLPVRLIQKDTKLHTRTYLIGTKKY